LKSAVKQLTGRRSFLRSGAAALSAGFWADSTLEGAVQNTQRNSNPSALRITDLRVATLARAPFTCPIIRIDTNQGVSGYGEVLFRLHHGQRARPEASPGRQEPTGDR